MANTRWKVTIEGVGPANTSDPDDADEILKTAYTALQTAGHTNLEGKFDTSTTKRFST